MIQMTDYEWLTEHNLCHKCRKQRPALGKKYCFDCLEIIREDSRKRYNPQKAKKYQERRREIYQQKKELGICVKCTKKATHGLHCYEHSIIEKRRSKERAQHEKIKRHERGLILDMRKSEGLCLWCGQPVMGRHQCCEKHSEVFSEAGKKGKENSDWAKEKIVKSKRSNLMVDIRGYYKRESDNSQYVHYFFNGAEHLTNGIVDWSNTREPDAITRRIQTLDPVQKIDMDSMIKKMDENMKYSAIAIAIKSEHGA